MCQYTKPAYTACKAADALVPRPVGAQGAHCIYIPLYIRNPVTREPVKSRVGQPAQINKVRPRAACLSAPFVALPSHRQHRSSFVSALSGFALDPDSSLLPPSPESVLSASFSMGTPGLGRSWEGVLHARELPGAGRRRLRLRLRRPWLCCSVLPNRCPHVDANPHPGPGLFGRRRDWREL